MIAGCTSVPVISSGPDREFDFARDTFAYTNELDWEYRIDPATSKVTIQRNEPTPAFVHRCFVVSKMARQFFQFARFDATLPRADQDTYRQLIDEVDESKPEESAARGRVVIPGFADLRSFSRAEEAALKAASGSSLHSYFQLSNWRMIFPFGRDSQEAMARHVYEEISNHHLPILHLIRFAPFPIADINHVVVVIAGRDTGKELQFSVYDPNNSAAPVQLSFDFASRSFIFPTTNYFADGPVNAYEIFQDDLD
jgi:hypothetical protein